ncbi:MAG: efflux RND transporter periplasmic adaptor subunit, partial [Chloroflexota bacterium]|nr:efflux RND transporter periplasmic adaptor subunit [Chloroflexota bacterium]
LEPGDREVRVENVTGSELNRLSVNQPVTITFSRFQNQPIEGRINALPQDNASTQSQIQADTAVHISYEAPDLDLELGDLATAVVTLQNRKNVLFLPPAALRNFQGRQFVVVQDGERQRRVDIEVGITGPDRVEIVEGLQEGQVVVGQ